MKTIRIISIILCAAVCAASFCSCKLSSLKSALKELESIVDSLQSKTENGGGLPDPLTGENKSSDAENMNYSWALQDTENYYGDLFGDGEVIKVEVTVSEENWKDLCENAKDEEYYPADITVNGVTLENVGFRTKGFSSLSMVASSDSNRYGFKVKTDKYVKGQTLNGLDMFVLNGSFQDASYMREYLTYAASEYLGMITPIFSYTSLYINGELFGFYLMIEAYDDSFVARNTDDGEAVLYKADSENCTLTTFDNCGGYDIKVGEDEGCENIKKLISALDSLSDGSTAQIESILDVDSALKAWAVNTVLGNYDSYSGSKAHNYYLLYSDGKFSYIGWDYNMSIGAFSGDNGASVGADVTTALYGVNAEQRPLISKLLSVPAYYERYIEYVDKLCEYFSDIESLTAWISARISDYVKNDPTAFYTYDQYEQSITKTENGLSNNNFGFNVPGGQNGGGFGFQTPGGQGRSGQGRGGQAPGGQGGGQMPGGQGGGQMPGDQGGDFQLPDGFDPSQIFGGSFPGGTDPGQGGGQTPGGQGGGQMPGGQGGDFQLPDGFDPSQIFGGSFPGGTDPGQGGGQMPDGFDPSQISGGSFPGGTDPGQGGDRMPDGFDPSQIFGGGDQGQGMMPGFGGGMMNSVSFSIVDYITQRIENIKTQLNK